MVERALVVVQAEQQRADVRARAVLVPAEAGDDAVGGALVLDLEHRPLARLVRRVEPLGDHAVEAGALEPLEPVGGGRAVAGRRASGGPAARRRRGRASSRARRSPCGDVAQVLVAEREQVPGDERWPATPRRASCTRDAAGWMRSSSASKSSAAVARR